MKAALLIVLSLSALAFAGPAFNTYDNQQQQQHMTTTAQGPVADILKQWCFSSKMSPQELTQSFKKLVSVVKSNPADQTTESAILGERICQAAQITSDKSGQQYTSDAQAHELIKDVYMDSLISCKSRDCTQQLLKIINSNKVDTVRASYYMTRIAVTEREAIKDESEIKQLAESFMQSIDSTQSESIERQKLFATTSLIGKWIQDKPSDSSIKQTAQQIAKTIVDRYIKPVTEQEIQQYQQQQQHHHQQQQQQSSINEQLVKKIAKRSAALKALANIPGYVLKQSSDIIETLVTIVANKQELATVRQSAIECLEQNDQALNILKQVTFDQQEPIEVRVAAYRALMTVAYAAENKDESAKQQLASQLVDQVVKHCEDSRHQQQDDQFVLYAISHLDNLRTSQQPEHQAIKDCIQSNKQHYMQIQVLCKKFQKQLSDVRRSSRNYKLEQEFNQLESGLVIEGDLIYESKSKQQQAEILPKVVRVNMSMPVMGETVNVVEITVRQNNMDEEILSALSLVGNTKTFGSNSMGKVVDSFKSSVEKQQTKDYSNTKQQYATEADLTIKVDGCTVVYLCVDDFKTGHSAPFYGQQHQRSTRSIYSKSIVEDVIEYLKRKPVAFNRGFNFNLNERLAKVLDVDANIIAGLRFESRATGQSRDNFEIVARMEPRFNFEAIVGPAKMTDKKLLQRLSTKTALGLRLRFKRDEMVDFQVDMPMNTMDLFTYESQLVEKRSATTSNKYDYDSYNYLPESIYGQEDIYSAAKMYDADYYNAHSSKLAKRSIFSSNDKKSSLAKFFNANKYTKSFSTVLEIPEEIARATGLKAKLNVHASPKDLSVFVSALVAKYEPEMEGFRFQVQKVERSQQQKSYVIIYSTPGSRVDRTIQVRLVKQSSSQRTVIKSEVQSAKLSASIVTEFVHDGRQYSTKTEIVSHGPRSQWRHAAELGLIMNQSGTRSSFAYKPYVNIDSTYLKRPYQLSGLVSYQETPKSVISYELRCQTSGDYVQGKIILDQRDSSMSPSINKRASSYYSVRRAMQSPLELLLKKDLTFTHEMLAQVDEHALKVHNMLDWDCDKYAVQADFSVSHKNLRKPSQESQFSAQMKFDDVQQVVTVERKYPQQERKDYRLQLASQVKSASSHQMIAELRYNGRRQSVVAYKHQIQLQKVAPNKYESQVQIELVDSEHKLNEKMTGRALILNERRNKAIEAELASRQMSAKVNFDFESLSRHSLNLEARSPSYYHKCQVRNDDRQFAVQSRTDKHGQMLAKLIAEIAKDQTKEAKLVLELPTKRSHIAADLSLVSGKLSSVALQTPSFATKGEFSFETISRPYSSFLKPFSGQNWRFKTNHKDLINREAYWLDSALNMGELDKRSSYLRFDSPVYRTDLEFDPTDFSTKLGMFARSKRSIDTMDNIYSVKDSSISQLVEKLNLGANSNKLWMLRSIISSPYAMDSLKQKARRALFEFADQRQAHRHSIDYSPVDERVNFQFEHLPMTEGPSAFQPRRLTGDLSTSWSRPSRMSLESDWMNFDVDAKPFDGDETYAKISALSRHPRSTFKKHDSEYRYKKDQGYKAWMKHQDKEDKKHQLRFESDESPKKYAKVNYESDKHGKANWEHKWRKYAAKRSVDQQDVWANKMTFDRSYPNNQLVHSSQLEWDEPMSMVMDQSSSRARERRDVSEYLDDGFTYGQKLYSSLKRGDLMERYSPIEYLKHTSARLNSQTYFDNDKKNAYKVDFDYQPQSSVARVNVNMPEDLVHSSYFEYKPTERLYKMQSKLYNEQRAQEQPIYDLYFTTKPVVGVEGLASGEQEPVFINTEHPMLEQPISRQSLLTTLFKQPMKVDYSDKYGRQASLDYDHSPLSLARKYDNLRQKRAAVYYKDEAADIEHQSTYDFYPETSFLGKFKPQYRGQAGDVVFKTSTKYGPFIVRLDSSDSGRDAVAMDIVSPIVNAKVIADQSHVKVYVDNKSQKMELSKLIRKLPFECIRSSEFIKKCARKFDSSRFEHETECLINLMDAVFKLKSYTKLDERQALLIEGHYDQQQQKAYAKVNGERVFGQLAYDLVSNSADIVLNVDNKRTFDHETRLVRTSDKFYTLQSMSSYKSRPLFKLTGKISTMVFEEPSHLFNGSRGRMAGRSGRLESHEPHVSTFEAILYEPSEMRITGQYDCLKKEARMIFKDLDENKIQETIVKFDEQKEDVLVSSRLSSPYGEVYVAKVKLNLPGLVSQYNGYNKYSKRCQYEAGQCSSEIYYSDSRLGETVIAKHVPGKYVSFESPSTGRQIVQLSY